MAIELGFAVLVLMFAATGCGGGTSTGGGTPPGTYNITITGTSGSTSHTTQVTLTVQ